MKKMLPLFKNCTRKTENILTTISCRKYKPTLLLLCLELPISLK